MGHGPTAHARVITIMGIRLIVVHHQHLHPAIHTVAITVAVAFQLPHLHTIIMATIDVVRAQWALSAPAIAEDIEPAQAAAIHA